jgi:uncharacterized protein YdaU (DUF1376 family)
MARKSFPSFPFYAEDWLSSPHIAMMRPEQEAAYLRLLLYCWESESSCIPNDDVVLARLTRLRSRWKRAKGPVLACFEPCPIHADCLHNPKLSTVKTKVVSWRKQKSEAGKRGMQARWHTSDNGCYPEGITQLSRRNNADITLPLQEEDMKQFCLEVPSVLECKSEAPQQSISKRNRADARNTRSKEVADDEQGTASKKKQRAEQAVAAPAKQTWITPYVTSWEQIVGGVAPLKQLLAVIGPVEKQLVDQGMTTEAARAEAHRRWVNFLGTIDSAKYNLHHFTQAHPQFALTAVRRAAATTAGEKSIEASRQLLLEARERDRLAEIQRRGGSTT